MAIVTLAVFANGCAVEVWEQISNSIPHYTWNVIRIHAGIKAKPC